MAYFAGFDIGTESVGWAVTDEQYRVLRKNGKALWGVRQFPEARKAEERRGFRVARRRLERREQRLALLRDIFAREIAAVDPAFFQRMEESRFWAEDKRPDGEAGPWAATRCSRTGIIATATITASFPRSITCAGR